MVNPEYGATKFPSTLEPPANGTTWLGEYNIQTNSTARKTTYSLES